MCYYGMLELSLGELPPDLWDQREQGAQAAFSPFLWILVCVGCCGVAEGSEGLLSLFQERIRSFDLSCC